MLNVLTENCLVLVLEGVIGRLGLRCEEMSLTDGDLTYVLTDSSGSELNLESHFTSEGSTVMKTFFYKKKCRYKISLTQLS